MNASLHGRAPRASARYRPALQWLTLAVALWCLNFILTFHNIWPTLWVTTRHELSIEIAVLLLGLAIFSELALLLRRFPIFSRLGPPSARFMTGLAVVLLVMGIGRYAEVTAPALYGRPVNLYWDTRYLPDVAAMLTKVASPWLIAVGAVALLGLLYAIFTALRWALARVALGLAVPVQRRAIAALSGSLVLLFAVGLTSSPLHTLSWFSLPVTGTYKRQVDFLMDAMTEARNGDILPPAVDLGDSELERIDGADVLLVFMESYGAISFDNVSMSQAVRDSREGLAAAIDATGRRVVSAFVESPTFGGASWLAHSSFMTGLSIDNSGAYDLLLTQDRDSLPRRFERNGYRTLALMPGLKRDWPEGAFYGFDTIYGEQALAYRGPAFGWWRIPDQYAVAKLDELELDRSPRPPLFVFFPTISTHIPFRPTPPYQPDWSRLTSAQPYDPEPLAASLEHEPDWTDLASAYAGSLRYAYEYWGGYLRARPDADFVLIVLGDHQPAASVTGEGARWDVPVHVIASRPEILASLQQAGFTPGLVPQDAPLGPMHELAPLLLRAFGSSESEVVSVSRNR